MGYFLLLKVMAPDGMHKLSYQKPVFQTAKIVKTNISSQGALTNESDNYIEIDDMKNNSLTNESLFHRLNEWSSGAKIFDKNDLDLNKIQYLEFMFDSFPIYVCLCQGIDDPYCFVRIFSAKKIDYAVEKTYNRYNPYYDLDMTIWIFDP